MPKLDDYNHFDGRHWETGSVANHYAYRGVKAPHTGQPYSEALLMGVSGGAVMGYFSFAYEGHDPQAIILTRNTFNPLETMLHRLGMVQDNRQTNKDDKARRNLLDALDEGIAPIVWADMYNLPHNGQRIEAAMWAMLPIVVYGYEENGGTAWLADRAAVPLTATTEELDAARARVKKTRFRLLTLEPPDPEKLPAAVRTGIWDCIKLFTEAPPRGTRNNFGLTAYRYWAELLTKPKQRMSWEREFPAGPKMYAGLTWAFSTAALYGQGSGNEGDAERGLYATFLDEASVILERPGLKEAAGRFRASAAAWRELAQALLPDDVAPFRETRELLAQRHRLFLERGNLALAEMKEIDGRLEGLKAAVAADFPLDAAGVAAFRERLSEQVLRVHDIEQEAVRVLQEGMA